MSIYNRPDFRTLNDFRKNHLPQIEGYFLQVVRLCKDLGMLKVGEISLDGTKIRAHASAKRSKGQASYQEWLWGVEEEIQGILAEADQVDAEEDRLYGERRGDELPKEIQSKLALKSKIEAVLQRFPGEEKEKINLTDPDCRFMKERKGVITPAYNCQLAVAEGQIIVGAEVVAEENDRRLLAPMVEEAERVTGEEVPEVIADSGYSSYDNYEYLFQRQKQGYIPDQYLKKVKQGEYQKPEHRYHKENFSHDEKRDLYRCPEGKPLRFSKERQSEEGVVPRQQRIYQASDYPGGLVRLQCTKARYRTIAQEKREPLQEEMRKRLLSEEGRQEYKKRLYTVEPIFGHLKYNLGFKSFLLRSLGKVRGEFQLMCIGYNLRKILLHQRAMAVG